MGLLNDLFNRLIGPWIEQIKKALGPFGKLFDLISQFIKNSKEATEKLTEIGKTIVNEINEWKNFKEDIAFRTGVVSIPKAIEQTREFIDKVIAAWHAIVDLAREIPRQIHGGQDEPTAQAEEAIADIEQSGIKGFLEKFPKLAKGLEKIVAVLAAIVGVLEVVIKLADDLTTIVDALVAIREEVEHGSTVFLSQKNPRRTLSLSDGGSIKIRVGNLHS